MRVKEIKGNSRVKESHYSPIRFIMEARQNINCDLQGSFVPFSQERDGLGRLIKLQKLNQNTKPLKTEERKNLTESSDAKLTYNLTPSTCIPTIEKTDIIEEQINRSFEFHDKKNIKMFLGNKIKVKGTEMKTQSSTPFSPLTSYYQSKVNKNTEPTIILKEPKDTNMGVTYRSRYYSVSSLPPIEKPEISDMKLTLKKIKSFRETENQVVPKQKQLQNMYPSKSVKNISALSAQDILSYKASSIASYKCWPKLNADIEKNNERFHAKMFSTKKLAYQIKKKLEEEVD